MIFREMTAIRIFWPFGQNTISRRATASFPQTDLEMVLFSFISVAFQEPTVDQESSVVNPSSSTDQQFFYPGIAAGSELNIFFGFPMRCVPWCLGSMY